jgi:anti-sigma factor RsiW
MNPEKMDDATRTELMNAEIDGVATEAQRAALAQLLQRDPSAREELEALRAVADLLGRTRAPQPPENFAEGVMTMVRRVRETGWIGRLKAALTRAGWSWGSQPEDSINLSPGHGYVSAGVGAPKRSREDVMARQQNMFQRRMIFAGQACSRWRPGRLLRRLLSPGQGRGVRDHRRRRAVPLLADHRGRRQAR